jgi:hypothetical protein
LQERVLATGAGWTMDGWPSADAILDQLMALTAPENAAELTRRSRLAAAVYGDAKRADDSASDLYGELLTDATNSTVPPDSRYRIYQSACRALDMAPLPQPAKPATTPGAQPRAAIGRLLRRLRG